MFGIPTETVSAVGVLAAAAARTGALDAGVVVAPDLGAVKLARRYGEHLDLPVAVVHKRRVSGETVIVEDITGEVSGRRPLVVDDMISTGGTIQAAIEAIVARGAIPDAVVAATHGLMVGAATQQLAALPIRRLLVADTVDPPPAEGVAVEVISVAAELATTIVRLHDPTRGSDLMALS
jgi:ribose-phosphate pyrophosphokinase